MRRRRQLWWRRPIPDCKYIFRWNSARSSGLYASVPSFGLQPTWPTARHRESETEWQFRYEEPWVPKPLSRQVACSLYKGRWVFSNDRASEGGDSGSHVVLQERRHCPIPYPSNAALQAEFPPFDTHSAPLAKPHPPAVARGHGCRTRTRRIAPVARIRVKVALRAPTLTKGGSWHGAARGVQTCHPQGWAWAA